MNGWWPGKVVNLMMREEGRAMANTSNGHISKDADDTLLKIMVIDH